MAVNRLNIHATYQLATTQGVTYELAYAIEFDSTSRAIKNVYLRQGRFLGLDAIPSPCLRSCSDSEFVQVDGTDVSTRLPAISSHGKWLTLWLSRTTVQPLVESILPIHNETFLSPPQSASSTSQLIPPTATTAMDTAVPYQTASAITFDTLPLPSDVPLEDDDQFWNSITEQTNPTAAPLPVNDDSSNTNNDTISDLYLTLLHATNKKSSPITSRSEHDRAVNTLAADVLWPLIVDQTNRRSEKKFSSSNNTTTTTQSISSASSTSSSTLQRNSPFKQLSSTVKTRRAHPYSTN